jgi:hypothetical protein
MKHILSFLLITCFTLSAFAQDPVFTHKEIKKESKKPKWELSISYPQIINPFNAGEKGFNETVRQRFYAERDTFIAEMKDWEINDYNREMGSYYELNDTVMYSANSFVSVYVSGNSYFSGAAHPNNWSFSINYDLEKNKEITLGDMYSAGYLNVLSAYCIKEIIKQKKQDMDTSYVPDDEWLKSGAGPDEKNFEVFNPTKEGFLITFITYQVGSYAEGPTEVFVPYTVLKDYLKPGSKLTGFPR